MPNYEYRCTQCERSFEVFQTLEERRRQPRPQCPRCKSKKVQHEFSVFQAVTSKKT